MEKVCFRCETPYETGDKRRRFCSQSCYWKHRKTTTDSNYFKAGHTPWNKNLKGIHLSPDTEFKKGQPSKNSVPVGTTSLRTDKNGVVRKWIKIGEPNKWTEYYRFVWIADGRKIPRGMILHHIDLDATNDSLDNLELLSRPEHVKKHNRWNTKNGGKGRKPSHGERDTLSS